jgi:cathepsin L
MTPHEWSSKYLGLSKNTYANRTYSFVKPVALPASIDWTVKGAVTPVKDQGQCGSCWAFSATGALEGAWFLKNGSLYNVSEQQLVDCSTAEGNEGCNGGLMDDAFQYVIDNGLTTDAAYPYTATGPNACQAKGKLTVVKATGFTDVVPNSETALMSALTEQPVSVAVEADQGSFQFYSSGVMTKSCGTQLDHGVLAVGYGTLDGQDYYKVKNSWGEDWGMKGYILLGRGTAFGAQGQCGIQMAASFPVV